MNSLFTFSLLAIIFYIQSFPIFLKRLVLFECACCFYSNVSYYLFQNRISRCRTLIFDFICYYVRLVNIWSIHESSSFCLLCAISFHVVRDRVVRGAINFCFVELIAFLCPASSKTLFTLIRQIYFCFGHRTSFSEILHIISKPSYLLAT